MFHILQKKKKKKKKKKKLTLSKVTSLSQTNYHTQF